VRRVIVSFMLLFFVTACAQQAAFISEPPGAQLVIDGKVVGTTPCTFKYRSRSGGEIRVRLEKEGFESLDIEVRPDAVDRSARSRWLAAGIIWSPLWLGTFFTKKLDDSYQIVMKQSVVDLAAQMPPQPDQESKRF